MKGKIGLGALVLFLAVSPGALRAQAPGAAAKAGTATLKNQKEIIEKIKGIEALLKKIDENQTAYNRKLDLIISQNEHVSKMIRIMRRQN